MKQAKRFLLDADTFIRAKNRHYAFDICPGYWTALLRLQRLGLVRSIDRVRAELIGFGDDLSDWVKNETPAPFFRRTEDQAVIQRYASIVQWVNSQEQYYDDAKERFISGADPWLTAFAIINGDTVVTYEEHRPEAKKSVPIPNVCVQFGVACVNPFQMPRELGVRFRSSRVKEK